MRPNSPPQTTSVSSSSAALLQILEKRRGGLVRRATVVLQARHDSAVVIPARMHQHDESHAALDHSAREQAVRAERLRGLVIHAIRSRASRAIPLRSRATRDRRPASGMRVRRSVMREAISMSPVSPDALLHLANQVERAYAASRSIRPSDSTDRESDRPGCGTASPRTWTAESRW